MSSFASNDGPYVDTPGIGGASSIRDANISISRLNREMKDIEEVAEGSFGAVKMGILEVDNKRYAIKQTKKPIVDEGDLQQKLQEVYALSVCDHPSILRYYDGWVEDRTVFVRTEWVPDGSVAVFERPLPETILRSLLHQIASALHQLHSRSMAHRDVKPENILALKTVENSFVFKLCDFGLARPTTVVSGVAETGETFKGVNDDDGDRNYLSREAFRVCSAPHIGPQADIYALGVTCAELMGAQRTNGHDGICTSTIATEYGRDLVELIDSMIAQDPQSRPDAFTVVCRTLNADVQLSAEIQERQRIIAELHRSLDEIRAQ